MTTIEAHLSNGELEASYKRVVDPIGKSHFHALWLLSCGYEVDEVAERCRSHSAGCERCSYHFHIKVT